MFHTSAIQYSVGHMPRKSYSRQAMQKFVQQTLTNLVISAGTQVRALDFDIPEEIIVKRFVIQVLPAVTGAASVEDGVCIASLCQSDSNNPDAGDPLDSNRLIRSACGSPGTPINLDETITMRKLAGSGVHLYIQNVSASSESYIAKVTLHYLEV